MSDREALAAALHALDDDGSDFYIRKPLGWPWNVWVAAARERLAQLPEKCERPEATVPCPDCHGTGKVYPAELVERIAKALYYAEATKPHVEWAELVSVWRDRYLLMAVAVLDALNETPA